MTPTSLDGEAARFASTADLERLRPDLERLVAQAVNAVRACSAKPDDTFGDWGELVAAIRSTAFHEGMLLERGVARLALCNPNLIVVPLDRPMPIVPAAREILRRNDGPLRGIRLSPEVHARESYAPDIVIVDKQRHTALILDVKRSLASYETRRLNELRSRMMAAAMIASDWLSIECRTPPIGDVAIAIIDGSDDAVDHDRGVWGLSEIGELLEVNGAGGAMAMLRDRFGEEVRRILSERCRTVLQREFGTRRPGACHGEKQGDKSAAPSASTQDAASAALLAWLDHDHHADDPAAPDDEYDEVDVGPPPQGRTGRNRDGSPARVGFAQSRMIQ